MNIDQLKYFQTVANDENIIHASQKLHITQQGLSANIIRLEKELDVYLFDRHGRQISLNENGRKFLKYVNLILQDYEEALAALRPKSNSVTKTISLYTTGRIIANRTVSGFLSGHQGIDVQLQLVQPAELERVMSQNQADFIITTLKLEHENYESNVLYDENYVILVSSDSPLAAFPSVTLQDTLDYSYALTPQGEIFRQDFNKICERAGFQPRINLTASSNDSILSAVQEGTSISVFGAYAYSQERLLASYHIKQVPLNEPNAIRTIYLLRNKSIKKGKKDHLLEFYQYAMENAAKLVMNPLIR